MKKITLFILMLICMGGLHAKYISAYSAYTSGDLAADDVVVLEDVSADSTGEYHKVTVSSLSSYVLGSATVGGTGSGDIITTDDTQTLTNKTFTSPNINSMDADGGSFDAGTLGTNSDILELEVDNLNVNGNSIISDTGDITFDPADYVTIPTGEFKYAGTAVLATGSELNITDATSNESIYDAGAFVIIKAAGDPQVYLSDGALTGSADEDLNIGSPSVECGDGHFDGTLYFDAADFNETALTVTGAELNYSDGVTSNLAGIDQSVGRNAVNVDNDYDIPGSGVYAVDSSSNTVLLTLPEISATNLYDIAIYIKVGGNNVSVVDHASDSGMAEMGNLHDVGALSNTAKHIIRFQSSGCVSGHWYVTGYYGFMLD